MLQLRGQLDPQVHRPAFARLMQDDHLLRAAGEQLAAAFRIPRPIMDVSDALLQLQPPRVGIDGAVTVDRFQLQAPQREIGLAVAPLQLVLDQALRFGILSGEYELPGLGQMAPGFVIVSVAGIARP